MNVVGFLFVDKHFNLVIPWNRNRDKILFINVMQSCTRVRCNRVSLLALFTMERRSDIKITRSKLYLR